MKPAGRAAPRSSKSATRVACTCVSPTLDWLHPFRNPCSQPLMACHNVPQR